MESAAAALAQLGSLAASSHVSLLATAFAAAGEELALVGGSVRDAFVGVPFHDLDFATSAHPDRILEIVKPISETQWDIGRAFGTIGAVVQGQTVEITTYRADAYDGETRKPLVEFGDTLEADLLRRDFTVNAMALRLSDLVLVDPSGGIEDILSRRLATPGAPEVSFGDDPLRMMRAARLTSQLGFTVTEPVMQAMRELSDCLTIVSSERVRDELSRLLCTAAPRAGLELMVETGIAALVLPELPALRLQVDEHHHHKDVYEHSLTVLDQAISLEGERNPGEQPDLTLRLAALLHDIGKPAKIGRAHV